MYLVFIMTLYFTLATVRLLYLFHKWRKRRKSKFDVAQETYETLTLVKQDLYDISIEILDIRDFMRNSTKSLNSPNVQDKAE